MFLYVNNGGRQQDLVGQSSSEQNVLAHLENALTFHLNPYPSRSVIWVNPPYISPLTFNPGRNGIQLVTAASKLCNDPAVKHFFV
jgi:hypothetical protein